MHFAKVLLLKVFCFNFFISKCYTSKYEPTWDSLDSRPLPEWYDKAKIGIFVHWGVYSAISYGGEWFWGNWRMKQLSGNVNYMKDNYKTNFTYQEFAPQLTGEFFDPMEWVSLFSKSGARYVVLTSKHHDGYTMWPSHYSFSWNSVDVGLHKDIVGKLSNYIRSNSTLRFGVYYSLLEWYNPLFLNDKKNDLKTNEYVVNKVMPELKDLVDQYKPDIVWSDGEWEGESNWWKSKEFLTWLYNESPVKDTVVTNDRWGSETFCKHGGFLTCKEKSDPGNKVVKKWENAMNIDLMSWGYRSKANIDEFITLKELIKTVAKTVSRGGNILINLGPDKTGKIAPIFQERLLGLGEWLQVNGEAIYETTQWEFERESNNITYYTKKGEAVYAIITQWPKDNVIALENIYQLYKKTSKINLKFLGYDGIIPFQVNEQKVVVSFPDKAKIEVDHGSYTLKFESINKNNK